MEKGNTGFPTRYWEARGVNCKTGFPIIKKKRCK